MFMYLFEFSAVKIMKGSRGVWEVIRKIGISYLFISRSSAVSVLRMSRNMKSAPWFWICFSISLGLQF